MARIGRSLEPFQIFFFFLRSRSSAQDLGRLGLFRWVEAGREGVKDISYVFEELWSLSLFVVVGNVVNLMHFFFLLAGGGGGGHFYFRGFYIWWWYIHPWVLLILHLKPYR